MFKVTQQVLLKGLSSGRRSPPQRGMNVLGNVLNMDAWHGTPASARERSRLRRPAGRAGTTIANGSGFGAIRLRHATAAAKAVYRSAGRRWCEPPGDRDRPVAARAGRTWRGRGTRRRGRRPAAERTGPRWCRARRGGGSAARLGWRRCRGLALPVDQLRADRVVLVAGRRREVAAGLVEREGEHVGLLVRQPLDAAVPAGRPKRCPVVERRLDLDPRVAGVHVQRNVRRRSTASAAGDRPDRRARRATRRVRHAPAGEPAARPAPLGRIVTGRVVNIEARNMRRSRRSRSSSSSSSAIGLVRRRRTRGSGRCRSSSSTCSRRPTARSSAVSSGPAGAVGRPAARRSSDQLRLLA